MTKNILMSEMPDSPRSRTLRTLVLFFVASLFVSRLPVHAQADSSQLKMAEPMPSVETILKTFVEALGGSDKITSVTTRVRKGTVEMSGTSAKGTVERYQKAPNKLQSVQEIPGYGTIETVFNGSTAWYQRPEIPLQEAKGEWLEDIKRQAEFYWATELKKIFPTMIAKGTQKIGVMQTYVIEAHPATGSIETLYFDSETGLLVRQDIVLAEGARTVVTLFEDYREVDGIRYPFTIRQGNMTIRYTEVRHDVQVEDSLFDKPRR